MEEKQQPSLSESSWSNAVTDAEKPGVSTSVRVQLFSALAVLTSGGPGPSPGV